MLTTIKKYVPETIKAPVKRMRERHLIDEIKKLDIESYGGAEDGLPWVQIKDGLKFFGYLPTIGQRKLYRALGGKNLSIPEDYFSVFFEIISRYQLPRSIPGEGFFNKSNYKPIRDPLFDYDLTKEREQEIANLFQPKKEGIFIDIGAYHGYGTMKIAQYLGNKGRVIAFETDSKALNILKKNIQENRLNNITVISKAVGGYDGKGEFFVNSGTVNSLNKDVLQYLGNNKSETQTVEVVTVDKVLNDLNISKIDHANITINGGEYDALEGMQNTLANSNEVTITLAGWYKVNKTQKVADLVVPQLKNMNFEVIVGKLGRVLAWKNNNVA